MGFLKLSQKSTSKTFFVLDAFFSYHRSKLILKFMIIICECYAMVEIDYSPSCLEFSPKQ